MISSHQIRIVAIMLLLYGAADMLIPGFCPYEVHLVATDSPLGPDTSLTSERSSTRMSTFEPSDPDDDCYCCSTRIRPQSPPSLGTLDSVHIPAATLKFEALAGFTPHPYHPPRLS